MFNQLLFRLIRKDRFEYEMVERQTIDILDKALVKAKANRREGVIDAPTFYAIEDKIRSLKKLKFTEDYESWRDKDTVEWMKYKVAAEVGGEE